MLGDRLDVARAYRHAKVLLRASPEELRAEQDSRLRGVLAAARTAEPYRTLWRGLAEEAVRSVADLVRLPVTAREDLQELVVGARLARGASADVVHTTSGTTGQFVSVGRSRGEDAYQFALVLRQLLAQGLRPEARTLYLTVGAELTAGLRADGSRATIGAFVPPEDLLGALRRFAPDVLIGPPSALVEVADLVGRHPVEGLLTFGEVLTPDDRERLRATYGVSPLDFYALVEAGVVAFECVSGCGYHVNADAVIVEVAGKDGDPAPAGEPGTVFVTNLWNRTTPVVRYRTGDVAARSERAPGCDLTLPVMGPVEGRAMDWIVAPSGRRVSPFRVLIGTLVPEWPAAIRRYRIVQRAPDDFLVEVVWRRGRREDLVDRIAPAYARVLGGEVHVSVEDAETMSGPRGKFRLVASRVGARDGG